MTIATAEPTPAAPADASPVSSQHGSAPHANYFGVFLALCACTALSVATDLVPLPGRFWLAAIVFGVAAVKAGLVMAYFMHLKFEGRWTLLLLAPTGLLALGLPLALLPDIGLHYYVWTDPAATGAPPVSLPTTVAVPTTDAVGDGRPGMPAAGAE